MSSRGKGTTQRLRRSQEEDDIPETKRGKCFNKEKVVNAAEKSIEEDREIASIEVISDFTLSSVNGVVEQKLESNGQKSNGTFPFNMMHKTHVYLRLFPKLHSNDNKEI